MLIQGLALAAALLSQPITATSTPTFELAVRSGVALSGYEFVNLATGLRVGKYLTVSTFYAWQSDRNACDEPLNYGGSFRGTISCEKGRAERAGMQIRTTGTRRFRPSFGMGVGWYKRTGNGIEKNIRYHGADDPTDGTPHDWRFTKLEEGFFGYLVFAPEYAISTDLSIAADFQAGLGRPYVISYNGYAYEHLNLAKQLYPIANAGLRLTYYLYP